MNRIKNNALQATAWLLSLLMSATAYAGAPTFSATLSPTTIGPGSLSTLTYTVDNTAQSSGATDLTFSTTLPTGVTLTAAPNATTTCINGIFTATGGSNSVTFTGYRLGANASCTLTMNITSSTAGTHTIPAATLSTSAGSVSNATVDLTVDGSRPGFTIAFSPSTITPGGISTLIYTIDNSRNGSNASSLAFYDTLPSGLLIADAPNVSTTCSGTASHTFSPGTSAFTGGVSAVTSGETCTVSVDVTAAVAGSYLHVSASLLQSFTNPSGSASAELLVSTSFVNAFFPGAVKPGDSVKLTYTLTNNDRANAATGITFTNDLNTTLSGLAATALPANDFCGSGSTMTGSSNLTINGANLVSGASCTFEVTVLIPAGAAAGTYTNSTSIINLTLGSATTKPIATNTLIVVKAPVVTAEFVDDPVTAGQDVTLRYTITNSDAVNTVSKITFTENINEAIGGIVIKTRPNSNSCGTGSTFTSNDNGNGLLYFGVADANLVGGANCTFDVILTLPADATPGTWGFSTTAPSGEINGATVYGTAVSHNLVVVSAPTLFLSITETDASPGSTVNAQFTLNYSPLAAADVTGVGFTVDLENALTGLVSTTATQNDVCGSGSTFGGTSTLTLSGASMSADSTCTFSVVLQIPADAVPSTISVLSSTVTGTSGGQSVSAASASDSVVISGLSWGVAVVTDPTAAGATNILRFTINNAATGLAATALSASMDLNKALSGLKGTSIPTDPCGAGSLLAGTTYLSFSGGSLQPGESCTFDVNILVPANASSGLYNLPTLPMSATVNGNNTSTPAVTTLMNVESLTVNVATSATAPYTTSPIPVNIDFSRSVTGFTVADLTVTNGTASNFAGSGLLYTADITPTASGTVTVSVPASVADDAVFNSVTNPASNTLSFTYDASPTFPTPTIAISAPSTSLANTGPVTYTVTYTNAAEISLSGSAITLNKTQSATATVTVTTVDSLTRTINLSSITGDGTLGVSINTGTAKNGDQQAPAIGPSSTFAVDNALPTVTINGPSGHVTEKFTATFTFSEDVSGFALADITVGNGSADNFTTTSATVYTADITPSFEGDVTVTVPASVVVDAANNGNVAAASPYVIKYDKVPTVAISGAVGHVSDPFTATFTFNENVTDFTLADITLFNATKSNFVATSATSYTADITPTNEGNFTVDVPASVAIDSISNPNTAAPQLSLTYDKRPTLTIGGPTGHVSEKFTATFTFNETVTGFSLAAIVPTNGTVDNFVTLTSKSYTADITPTSEGPVYVDVSSDVAFDTVNNGNIFAPQYTITYDKIPSLVIDGPTGHVTGKYTNIFTFNETVTGFTIDDITLFNATKDNFVTLSAGVSYSVDVTPTAEGAGGVTVDVPANAVLDSIGNANLAPTQYTVVYDKVPTVAISGPSGHVNDKFTATVTFNEPVTEFILADISVTNGSADNFVATSSTVYTADISPTNEGTVTLNVAASVAIDSVSNPNLEASPYTITYDKVPTVTITGPAIPAKEKFTAVFTFNEIVTEFVLADITVGNGTADNFVVTDGKIYTADITPATEGNVTVDVAASVAIDSVSNNNAQSNQLIVVYDTTSPTLTISGISGPINDKFTTTFTFTEDVSGFTLSDITVGNGSADNFVTTNAKQYTADITPTTDGTVTVDVVASSGFDTAGNGNVAAPQYSVLYDKTDPTVTISGTADPVNALFSATFTFNEDVTGFVQTDITVANATLGNFIATNAKTYTVDVTPTIDGPVTLDVAAGVATDSATNGNTAATQYSVTYDATHPTLLITGPTATINGPFTTTFTFSEDVTGFELADIVVGNASIADFTALNASAKIYTAVVSPTTDGQQVTVDVAASVAIDTSTNPNVAASQFSVGYDMQKPGVTVTGPAGPLNTTFTATITFSKAVLDFNQSKITVVNAGLSNFVATNAPIYTVLVTPIIDGDVSVSVADAVVSDAPGNTNVASNVFTLVYDTTNPTIVSLAPANNEVDVAIKPDLVITFDETVTVGTTNNLIEIKNLTTNAVMQSYAANTSAVSINDKVVTIALTSELPEVTEFYVTIGTNAFTDTATNQFAGISDNATWHFKIINLPPLTVADNAVVLEDTSVIIDVLNNDNGDNSALNPASVTVKTAASNGVTTVNTALGMITYTPNANYNGTDTFTYIVSDMLGTFSAQNTITVTVGAANDAPIAVNDTATTSLNNATTINVLGNDSDVDGTNQLNSNTITITAQAKHGELTLVNGSVSYQPAANYSGSDTFSYTVSDTSDTVSNVGLVTINVTGTNATPIAVADSATTSEDTATTINVLSNDTDSDGQIDVTTVAIAGKPADGTTSVNTDGTITYTPNIDFAGNDSFSYTVKDNGDARSAATNVTVTVSPVNDVPTVSDDTVIVVDTTSAHWINVIGNDKDVDGTISSVTVVTQPTNGTVTVDSTTLLLLFTPTNGFTGTDSFTYRLTDNNNTVSSTATVNLSQTPVNVAPLVNDDSIQTDEDQFIDIDVLANDSDFDGQIIPVTLTITTPPTNGSASVKLSDGTIFYTPNANFSGSDSFVYQVSDNSSAPGSATVHIQVNNVNDVPLAVTQTVQTNEDSSLAITVSGIDADGDNLTYQIDSYPNNGTLSGTLPNMTYTPSANFNGADNFKFIVNDGIVDSTAATVTITVAAQNDAPLATAQTVDLSEDTPKAFVLNGSDVDNDTLSYVIKSSPTNGQLTGSGANLTYAPNADFNGTDSFTFAVNDGTVDSPIATVNFNIAAINDAPVAQSQNVQTSEDTAVDIVVVATDAEQDNLTYTVQQSPTHGVFAGVLPNVTYAPDANYSGTDSFIYFVNDGLLNSAAVTVNITIDAVNDQPVAISRTLITAEDLPLTITLTATDADNDALTYTATSDPANGVLSGIAPNLVYTPNTGFNGNDSFDFTANDGTTPSDSSTINITITAINNTPLAIDDVLNQIGWAPAEIDVLANDSDADGDSLSIIGATADVGTISFTTTRLTYTPVNGFIGSTTVDYTISDGQGSTTNARVQVTITAPPNGQNLAIITVPEDIEINANAMLSKVDLGIATAKDSNGNTIAVALLDDTTFFKPGINTVYWSATDDNGQTTIASQTVTVHPLVSLDNDQVSREGYSARVGIRLNGTAPSYPLNIPYTVSGTADVDSDHNLVDGIVTIESGIEGFLNVNLFDDGVFEGEEKLVITLGDTLNRGQQFSHTITLIEENVAPKVNLQVFQRYQQNAVVNREDGTVEIKAQVTHPDSNNQYSYQWGSSQQLINLSATENGFAFEPDELTAGLYHIELTITDIDDSQFTLTKQVTIKVQESAIVLGTGDSDHDGVSDVVEGAGDGDNDGIADYLDAIDACNVLPGSINSTKTHLVETQPGVCLRLGDIALNRGNSGVRIDETTSNAIMDSSKGSLYDLVADKLPMAGQSTAIVLPQVQPIPADAIYRLQLQSGQWTDFVENTDNQLQSSAGESGYCPPPGGDNWQAGLIEGYWCIQLKLSDGGPNDGDNQANGTIVTPGRVEVLIINSQPMAQDDEAQTRQNVALTIDVLANDTDNDNDNLSISTANAQFGSASIIDNQIHYQPATDLVGVDTIIYGISDGQGGSSSATLLVTVLANTPPNAADDFASVQAGQSVVIDVLSNDSDDENDSLSVIAAFADKGTVTIGSDFKLTYKPNSGFSGTDNIDYLVSDAHGGETAGLVSVSVAAIVATTPAPTTNNSTSSGGGSFGWLMLIGLGLGLRRRAGVNV